MKKYYFLALIITISSICNSQSILNGSFETNTAPNSCTYNNTVTQFNSYMPNIKSIGNNGVDIHIANCFVPNITDGIYAVGIGNADEGISFELSQTLINGQNYTLTFDAYSQTDFGSQGNIVIGISDQNTTFGTQIYEAVTIASQWSSFQFSFTAPNNGLYLTVMQKNTNTLGSWNIIDNFSLSNGTLSIDDLNFENKLSLFPNPSSNFIIVSNLKSTESYLIINQIGQEIKRGIISNKEKIDIRNFTNGLYFLKFDNGITTKFIKE
ncbi:MAG: T9SS type A sorting domain-containing protein [Flavobacteriales bacterium]|nr:T9SS type A sorting domain-containing protein [Flavobacteriales bacterium]MDG1766328.1 T9SS type A sorting domain-containing protein [Flavobacteriales bacterium]